MAVAGVPLGDDAVVSPGWRHEFVSFASRGLLGAAAGGLGGLIVGGVGGRLAMLLLRLTSPDLVRGLDTDDGFEIGAVTLSGTIDLFAVTMVLGAVAGLFVVLSLRFMPWRWMPLAWALPGATLGGTALIHGDGLDFTLLKPHLLAVALFIAIPAVGAATIAAIIRMSESWWWKSRYRTAVLALAAWPLILLFPAGLAVLAMAAAWGFIGQNEAMKQLPATHLAQRGAMVVFSAVTLGFAVGLVGDLRDVL